MLPTLFKLRLDTSLFVLAVLLSSYGFWTGWRSAEKKADSIFKAIPFAAFAGLVGLVAIVYIAPPMTNERAEATKIIIWTVAIVLTVSSLIYGYRAGDKNNLQSEIVKAGSLGLVASIGAIRLGVYGGKMGHGFGLPLHTYGFLMAVGLITALWLGAREAPRSFPEMIKVDGELVPYGLIMRNHILELGFWLVVSVIVGAKVLYVITTWDQYNSPLEALLSLFSLSGGLVFYGGFIGGAAMGLLYCYKHKISFLRVADVLIPCLAIGHSIGRLGCLAAGCCWGGIAKAGSKLAIRFPAAKNLPFGGFGTDSLAYADQAHDHRWVDSLGHIYNHSVNGAQQISAYAKANGYSLPVYPTQLMESLGELLLFIFLIWMRRNKRFNGQLLATWLICYAILRFILEFFRGDEIRNFPIEYPIRLSTSQTIALCLALAGITIIAIFGRKKQNIPAANSDLESPGATR